MYLRMIINDFKANKLVSAATFIFMAVTAMLLGLSVFLFGSLANSIDDLMAKAGTPDFLQMHTGELYEEALSAFAQQREETKAMQVCTFLNLPNGRLSIGDKSLENNMQDNGLCCQSELFDFLVDAQSKVIHPSEGEVYVPVCYRKEYGIKPGDIMRIGTEELLVAGFLRDSQMNSMMASSKRFLVSETDYERLRPLGSEEYLIEFKLREGSDINAFATAYRDEGLPDNGPTITYSLIRMMNALSDGMMIFIILLISVVALFISILCIRYIILTQLEKDKRRIGMMKAVGISRRGIGGLYFAKYLVLSAGGCLAGAILAAVAGKHLGTHMRELYGDAGNMGAIYAAMVLGAAAAEGVILLAVYLNIRRTDKLSAVEALCGADSRAKKNLWLPASIITAAAMFMILVPWNIRSTLNAPEFVTYMGIGESRIRIDIRPTESGQNIAAEIAEEIRRDSRVSGSVLMQTGSYKTVLPDGSSYDLMIENGDHSKFPVRYTVGRYPRSSGEIALSVLNAEEMGLKIGDEIIVRKETGDGEAHAAWKENEGGKAPADRKEAGGGNAADTTCVVCGIYSDITNGGKTAKSCLKDPDDRTPVMWSIIYLSLEEKGSAGEDERAAAEWVSEYRAKYSAAGEGVKVTLISDYLKGTYGRAPEVDGRIRISFYY